MSDTRILIELRVTHEKPLPADPETIARLAAQAVNDSLGPDDPVLLATATATRETRESVYVDGWMAAERNALENLRWRGSLRARIRRSMRQSAARS